MGNKELVQFKSVALQFGDKILKDALDITSKDIQFNRVSFGKRTSSNEFMKIFFRSLSLCLR